MNITEAKQALREARRRHRWKEALAYQSQEHRAEADEARREVLDLEMIVNSLREGRPS